MVENDILDFYMKARNDPELLCHFGFHYGILSILAFSYCQLRVPLDISNTIGGYFKYINSETPEFIDTIEGRKVAQQGVPIIHNASANDGIVFATIDKFTPERKKCMEFLLRMRRFSKVEQKKTKYIYTIVERYVQEYKLLEV
jgi:hypothetical protein